HHEVDGLGAAERDNRAVIGTLERHAFGFARDACIARCAIDPLDQRARRDLPGERMLAPAAADEEDVHEPTAGEKAAGGVACYRRLAIRRVARVWTDRPPAGPGGPCSLQQDPNRWFARTD